MARRKTEVATAPADQTANDALLSLLAAGLRLQATSDLWRVSGNTLPHRTLLRDAGGTWNKLDQCWEFAGEDPTPKLATAIASLPSPAGHNTGEAVPDKPHYHGRCRPCCRLAIRRRRPCRWAGR